MSFQIYWEKLDKKVASDVQKKLNDFFAKLPKNSNIAGEIHVQDLDFGVIPPQIELVDITEPFPEFYLPTEDSEDDDNDSANGFNSRSYYSSAPGTGRGDYHGYQLDRASMSGYSKGTSGRFDHEIMDSYSIDQDQDADLGVDDTSEDGRMTTISSSTRNYSIPKSPLITRETFGNIGYGGAMTPHMRFFGRGGGNGAGVVRGDGGLYIPVFGNGGSGLASPLQGPNRIFGGQNRLYSWPGINSMQQSPTSTVMDKHNQKNNGYVEKTEEDIQFTLKLKYSGDMTATLATKIQLNYPADSFISLPVTLYITKIRFEATAVVAHLKDRINLCFLEPEESNTSILQDMKIRSEIGDNQTHVLKNVEKIETFIIDQLRHAIDNDFVFPSYSSIELDGDDNQDFSVS
ncbi:Mitochondrial distribution and morphology protein 12 [Mycoemilia scoparia]|uniref:Mitochondrial distribution and morphology protein 12 n=1 Tax=Mycoemilia scoparia TaxID=417184 RepID=A0A9W7ZS15_9FUNG|nr:Mitochondrial distribution and morphology protein 12 [Mycoemilia scoparia]